MEHKRLFLLDAYALIFRAYYALIKMPRITSTGLNTSAVFGFVNTLEELLRKEKPTHIAICFDPPGPTFRHEAFEAYKGEREATPEDIKISVPIIKEIIRAYRIPIIEVEGYEADDVIGTLATKAGNEGFSTFMMTPDKDFGQLVSDNVFQYKPGYRGGEFEIRGVKEVCERYEISSPDKVIDLLALMGDKVDNIPGCPGVGEKTAIKLINDFGSIENLIENTDSLKGALKKKVEDNKEQIVFSKFLATIKTDVPIDCDIEELKLQQADIEELTSIFRRLEFRTLIDKIAKKNDTDSASKISAQPPQAIQGSLFDDISEEEPKTPMKSEIYEINTQNYHIIKNSDEIGEIERFIAESGECAVFIVAQGDSDMTAQWVGTALALHNGKTYYIDNAITGAKEFIVSLHANEKIKVISSQTKRDYVIISNSGLSSSEPIRNYYDITIAHYLLQPEIRHSIDNLALQYLNLSLVSYSEIAGSKGAKQLPMQSIGIDKLSNWACQQADATMRLYPILSQSIEKENLSELLNEIELPLTRVLAEIEIAGVRIDVAALNEASETLTSRLDGIETEIHALVGENFNIGSPAQVGEILFDKLKLDPKAKKTKTGQYSTSEEVLEKISHLHPVVNKILEYRQLKKLLSTYLNALPNTINPTTGKIHTTYNQTVTATGRLSSTDPNLQNIPVRDEIGREIRRAFIADEGHTFLSADYSQIELRLVADFSNDKVMLDAFANDKDIHAITAAKIYKTPLEEVTATQRRNAKTANFGILYGISAFGLASRLGIPRSEAKQLIDGYFETFPTVQQYMSEAIEKARENGYVTTIKGRKRMLPDINSRNAVVRGYAERNAINAPIQGSAADIIKIAMVNIFDEIAKRGLKSKMIMQVHDELNFDVLPQELDIIKELVCRNMQNAYNGRVSLTASCGTGPNWLTAH